MLGTRHAILVDRKCGILTILYSARISVQSLAELLQAL